MSGQQKLKIGLALGSGSARGMAHVGIIEELETIGIRPDIICGSSVGSIVGATFILGKLPEFTSWVSGLSRADIFRYMDVRLAAGGGFAHGRRLMEHLSTTLGNPRIEHVRPAFAAIATDLSSGREIWLSEGPIWEAVRASIALPGMLSPVTRDGRWLVDGGVVNPVPVSVCRALGAEIIIAVNLNGDLIGRHSQPRKDTPAPANHTATTEGPQHKVEVDFLERMSSNFKLRAQPLLEQWLSRDRQVPGIFDVMAASINIMQDRITRSRLAGEPADVMLNPRLSSIGLLDLDRAAEAIEEGRSCVQRNREHLEQIILNTVR